MEEEKLTEKEWKAKKKKKSPIGCIVIVLIIAVFLFIVNNTGLSDNDKTSRSKSSHLELSKSQLEAITDLVDNGSLKINYNLNEAFIDPIVWHGIDYQTKENFCRTLAIYCGNKKGTKLYWVDIKDNNTGKKLAKYSNSLGFKIY